MAPFNTVDRVIFYTFNMAGQIVLLLSLLTVVFARLDREMTLVNVAISTIIFSTACLLLLYADAYDGPEPPFGLCLVQASLIYGSLPMGGSALFCLFFQLWNAMYGKLEYAQSAWQRVEMRLQLELFPWLIFFGMVFGCIADGLRDRSNVGRSRDFFYCSASARMGYTCEIICGIVMLGTVVLELHVVYLLIYGWRTRTLRRELLPVNSLIRLGLFSVYGLLTVVVTIVLLQVPNGTTPRHPFIFMSTMPLAVWLVFWTQKDMLRIWFCLRAVSPTLVMCDNSEAQRLQYSREDMNLREMRVRLSC